MNGTDTTEQAQAHELMPLVYDELRRLANHKLGAEQASATQQPTALVHEAYLRLISSGGQRWKNRRYFFGAAAEAMRRILIERARAKQAIKRGSGASPTDIDGLEIAEPMQPDELLALDAALDRFAVAHPDKAELVKLKFFIGLPMSEAASALGISDATAKRAWAFSRAWLFRELSKGA